MILCDGVFQMAGVAEVPEAGEETEIIRKLCYQVILASFPTFPLFYKIQFLEIFPLKLNFSSPSDKCELHSLVLDKYMR